MAAEDIVFYGVGKTRAELAQGLDRGIVQFTIEHEPEGIALAEIALAKETNEQAVLRVTTDVDADTHAKISTDQWEHKSGDGYDAGAHNYTPNHRPPGANRKDGDK